MSQNSTSGLVPVLGPDVYVPKGERDHLLKPHYTLSPEQKELLKQFRESIEKDERAQHFGARQKHFLVDDACLLRYLRAREWNLDKSKTLIFGTLEWINVYGYDVLSKTYENEISHEGETGKTYRNGKDKLGRPVVYMRDRNQNTKTYDDQVRFTVYQLDMTIASMDLSMGVEQWALIIDFNGYTMSNAPPMKVSKQVLDIMMEHFPERLGIAFMIDPPFLFTLFWRAISPFIPAETKAKVKMVSGSIDDKRRFFSEYFDLDQLESDFGGDLKCTYDHSVYWPNDLKQWETRNNLLEEKPKKKKKKNKKHKKKAESKENGKAEKKIKKSQSRSHSTSLSLSQELE